MTEKIATTLIETLDGIIAVGQDQEGTNSLPYAVYTMDVSPSYIKGRAYKISGSLIIRIYTASPAEGQYLREKVEEALERSMQNNEFRTRLTSVSSNDDNGKYLQTLEYSVAQLLTIQTQ